MADTVRYLMEEMIPELEDLEQRGYFSRAEIKAIAQKRQDFEYHLKRRAAMKRDFLRYIQYECKLEELRRYRRKERGIKGKQKGLAETGILKRIHFIYERATRKFKADLGLWFDWIEYCKRTKSNKQFSKVVTKALSRHSHVAALWVEAAAWEFEHTGNVAAARSLCQRGLRNCPRDEGLWAEYMRLELLYVAKLRARRAVLGLPNPDQAEDFKAPANVKRKEQSAASSEDGDEDVTNAADVDGEAAVRSVLTGAVVRAVVKGAVSANPNKLSLRCRLLKVLREFDFPGVAELQQHVYDGIASDFKGNEQAWDLLARRHWPACLGRATPLPHLPSPFKPASSTSPSDNAMDVDSQPQGQDPASSPSLIAEAPIDWQVDDQLHEQCCAVYAEGLQACPTAAMRDMYLRYLGQRALLLLQEAGNGTEDAVSSLATVGAQLLSQYKAAVDSNVASEDVFAGYVDWAMALAQPKVAIRAAKRACEAHPSSMVVWSRRLSLDLELHMRGALETTDLVSNLSSMLSSVPAAEAYSLWDQAFAAIPPQHALHTALQKLLITRLQSSKKAAFDAPLGSVVGNLIRSTAAAQGLEPARKLYTQLLHAPSAGVDMFKAMIDVEETSRGGAAAHERALRQVFEAAVDAYGDVDTDLWLRYARFESKSLKGVGNLYWRATKALGNPDAFIEQYRQEISV